MRKMILAIALIGMAILLGAAPTPGLAGEAGLQFVGYRHGSSSALTGNAPPIITAVTTTDAAVITNIMTVRPIMAAVDTITRSTITAVVAADTSPFCQCASALRAA
jgi:hypothetical protein